MTYRCRLGPFNQLHSGGQEGIPTILSPLQFIGWPHTLSHHTAWHTTAGGRVLCGLHWACLCTACNTINAHAHGSQQNSAHTAHAFCCRKYPPAYTFCTTAHTTTPSFFYHCTSLLAHTTYYPSTYHHFFLSSYKWMGPVGGHTVNPCFTAPLFMAYLLALWTYLCLPCSSSYT